MDRARRWSTLRRVQDTVDATAPGPGDPDGIPVDPDTERILIVPVWEDGPSTDTMSAILDGLRNL